MACLLILATSPSVHAQPEMFSQFPMGTGTEQYPSYTPFVKARNVAYNGTILGELRISKFLLEHFSGQTLVSFRPGQLSIRSRSLRPSRRRIIGLVRVRRPTIR